MARQRKTRNGSGAVEIILANLRENGASEARLILARDVVTDERVRLKCQVPLCDSFGRNFMCPPFLPTVSLFREVLAGYETAILIQVSADLKKTRDHFLPAGQLHELVNLGEKEAYHAGFRFAMGFIGGCCRLCESCAAIEPSRACRHPFKARPSMEAMGIDVQATAEKAGLPFAFPVRDRVVWTGLILL